MSDAWNENNPGLNTSPYFKNCVNRSFSALEALFFHQHASYEAPDQDEEQINKNLIESEESKLEIYFIFEIRNYREQTREHKIHVLFKKE